MLSGPLVFVDVDTQRDFIEPDGLLLVPGANAIVDNLARLSDFARRQDIPVLATACSHTPNDPEMTTFGPHCIAGTSGERRIPATDREGGDVVEPSGGFSGAIPTHLTLKKRDVDIFKHPEADAIVERYNKDRPTFVVYGVATDYCVAAAVFGLLSRGCKVAVVADAVRAIDAGAEANVFEEFTRRGALLTVTEVVTDSFTLQQNYAR